MVNEMEKPVNKSRKTIKKIGKFVREISAIVIGVAITLFASYWLNMKNEKRDMALYLNAIKLELDENIKTIDYVLNRHINPDVRYTAYLSSHDIRSLNRDSIESYSGAYYNFATVSFNSDAFEMFKISGIMRLMDDKELLMSICNAYHSFKSLSETFDIYFQEKTNDLKKESPLLPESERKEVTIAPMYNFYILQIPYILSAQAERVLKRSNEVLSKLEKVL